MTRRLAALRAFGLARSLPVLSRAGVRPGVAGRFGLSLAVAATMLGASAALSPLAAAAPAESVASAWHGTSWAVPLSLGGKADAGTNVTAEVPCAIGTCSITMVADKKGAWKGRLDAVVRPNTAELTVTLRAGGGSEPHTVAITPPVGRKPGSRTVMVIGDSLAVGTASVLPPLLPGRATTTEAVVGRTLAQGLDLFAHTPLDAKIKVVVFSLFTNDDPAQPQNLLAAVRATSTRLGTKRCAVWLTIRRPKVNGISYQSANAQLLAEAAKPTNAGRLLVVDWYAAVAAQHRLVGKDRVHPTTAGYATRARLIADAVKRCKA